MKFSKLTTVTLLFGIICLVCSDSSFNVQIQIGPDDASSYVDATGQTSHTITDAEKSSFGLANSNGLYAASKTIMGATADSIYLRSSESSYYSKYGFQEVTTVLAAIDGQIASVSDGTTVLAKSKMSNPSSLSTQSSTKLSQTVQNTITTTWQKSSTVTVSVSVETSAEFLGAGGKVTGSISGAVQFGQSGSNAISNSAYIENTVSVTLAPHQTLYAFLTSTLNQVTAIVNYQASLTGCVIFYYKNKVQGHYIWCIDINEVLDALGVPETLPITQTLQVGYYGDSSTETSDSSTFTSSDSGTVTTTTTPAPAAAGSSQSIQWNGNWAYACDFSSGDLTNAYTTAANCGPTCQSTSRCTHFTWTTYNGGTCWMKYGSVSKSSAYYTGDNSMVCGLL